MTLEIRTTENAPSQARPLLTKAQEKYGFVPNLLGVMANAPPLLEAYMTLAGLLEKTSFTAEQRHVILLSISTTNDCAYCVAAHSALAKSEGVPDEVIAALRGGWAIPDPQLEALRRFAAAVVSTRGWPDPETKQAFLEAGYTDAQGLEVVLAVGMKTLSNYTNHMARTPVDKAFASQQWSPERADA